MNREIKFRVWDTVMENDIEPYTDALPINEMIDHIQSKGEIVMQYTGWKDKNKKDIYEGDVCSYKNGFYKICWGEILGGFHQVMIPKHTGHFLQNQCMNECEVIGNIYQNPELLK